MSVTARWPETPSIARSALTVSEELAALVIVPMLMNVRKMPGVNSRETT